MPFFQSVEYGISALNISDIYDGFLLATTDIVCSGALATQTLKSVLSLLFRLEEQ